MYGDRKNIPKAMFYLLNGKHRILYLGLGVQRFDKVIGCRILLAIRAGRCNGPAFCVSLHMRGTGVGDVKACGTDRAC